MTIADERTWLAGQLRARSGDYDKRFFLYGMEIQGTQHGMLRLAELLDPTCSATMYREADEAYPANTCKCCSCGHEFFEASDDQARFCPHCGRRIDRRDRDEFCL